MRQKIRTVLAPIIILATIAAFTYYLLHHPETVRKILNLPPATVAVLLVLYAVLFFILSFITKTSLRAYDKPISNQENMLFNAYSSLINFFGPGQSGPAFRGVYLKKRHNLEIKKYLFITLVYYAFYAVVSAFMMFVGSRPWWQTVLLMVLAGLGSFVLIRRYQQRSKVNMLAGLHVPAIGWLFVATVAQLSLQAVVYGIELHNVQAHASVGQVLAYTGVSNFALFASLTPGAIGIREAFLVFSQNLHHIDSSLIVAANVIDRAIYLVFLGGLFVMTLVMHAKDKLRVRQLQAGEEKSAS